MAQKFRRYANRHVASSATDAIGTSWVRIGPGTGGTHTRFTSTEITATSKAAIIVGMTLGNVSSPAASIKASVALSDDDGSSNLVYIASLVPIPAGDSIELIQGKLVIEQLDSVWVKSDTATSLDVVMSVLQDV